MNPAIALLHPYPFERLNALKNAAGPVQSTAEHIALSIGEPQHPTPNIIIDTLTQHLHLMGKYPATAGLPELRHSIAQWVTQRFALSSGDINAERNVVPVNGTREALFSFIQCLVGGNVDQRVIAPNPFYQVYEGAAILAGAHLTLVNCDPEHHHLPNFDSIDTKTWESTHLLLLCSPHNPTGGVHSKAELIRLIELAQKHDFVIVSDECYSEIYPDENTPPSGLLEACHSMGLSDFNRCIVMHSLSKRSNAPGLRSGFVAGDAALLQQYLKYRTYHGCAMSLPIQHASIAAWNDEDHVRKNRDHYREKFSAVLKILKPVMDVEASDASFYLWPKTPIADDTFAAGLYTQQNVTVLPGRYLSREANGINPGENRIRMALVAELDECVDAATRIKHYIESL